MTKTKETIYKVLTRLPLLVTLTAFFFMPDEVPVHFGINNEVDRWGSKYELLILPLVIIAVGILIFLIAKSLDKNEQHGSNNFKVCTTIGIAVLFMFNIMTYYTLYISFMGFQDLEAVQIDFFSLMAFLLGFVVIIIGNVGPKVKMNSLLGLRTKWSMSSEEAWKKSQRFSGYSGIITGCIMIVLSFVLNGSTSLFISVLLLLAKGIIDTVYSYYASK
ncbi:MAG: SdpI family protein [Ruminococcus sp.]|nr:SdpI family protein [Ruminococcus sp.]